MIMSRLTLSNLESALAGESMAHIKYRYFARIAREEGYEDIAKHFEATADQEIKHAWGHLELLIGKPTTKQCLQKAIDGETYEYTEMYPEFQAQAVEEQNDKAAFEFLEQGNESKVHAERFKKLLDLAEKRFAALAKVEKRHAEAYQRIKETL
jgi:rubrerythrin